LSNITHILDQVQTSRSSHRPPLRHLEVWERQFHRLTKSAHSTMQRMPVRVCECSRRSDERRSCRRSDERRSPGCCTQRAWAHGELGPQIFRESGHMANCVHKVFRTGSLYPGPFSIIGRRYWRMVNCVPGGNVVVVRPRFETRSQHDTAISQRPPETAWVYGELHPWYIPIRHQL